MRGIRQIGNLTINGAVLLCTTAHPSTRLASIVTITFSTHSEKIVSVLPRLKKVVVNIVKTVRCVL